MNTWTRGALAVGLMTVALLLVYATGSSSETRPTQQQQRPKVEWMGGANAPLPFQTPVRVADERVTIPIGSTGFAEQRSRLKKTAPTMLFRATKGKFQDEYDTGNEPIDEDRDAASIEPNATFVDWFTAGSPRRKQTELQRATGDKSSPQCYYRVRDFCVKDGALLFIRPRGSAKVPPVALGDGTSLRLCNELRAKINLRFFTAEEPPAGVPWEDDSRPAHVTACWQYYGYHLMQCVATAFVAESLHGFIRPGDVSSRNVDMWLYNHAISLPQVSREHYSHRMYMGGRTNWSDTAPRRKQYYRAPWWALWSQATSDPSRVEELFKFPVGRDATGPDRCYHRGLIGHPNHNAVLGPPRRAHRMHLDALFLTGGRHHDDAAGTAFTGQHRYRILVTQRGHGKNQGGRRILNLPDVVAALQQASPAWHVDTVDWATLSVEEQYRRAARADVVIAMHGAGNAWILAQRPRTAFIEIWPQCVARNVYLVMAKQYNVRYYSLCLQLPQSAPSGSPEAKYGFLHHSLEVPVDKLVAITRTAADYLAAVRS
jgi:hypothetical protein